MNIKRTKKRYILKEHIWNNVYSKLDHTFTLLLISPKFTSEFRFRPYCLTTIPPEFTSEFRFRHYCLTTIPPEFTLNSVSVTIV
jgi:hypothetical protein